MYRVRLIFLLLNIGWLMQAQSSSMVQDENQLHILFDHLYNAKTDTQCQSINDSICLQFNSILSLPSSFDYPFDSLQYVGKVYSTDQKLRIYTWNYITQSGDYHFNCFIQRQQDNAIFRLVQNSRVYLPQETGIILPYNWYGALYYEAIPIKNHRKTDYVLLGWSRYSSEVNFKTIDILSFVNNQVHLGKPFIQRKNIMLSRVIIPYSSRYALTLQYDAKKKMILFNHLSSQQNTMLVPDENFSACIITKSGLKFKDDLPLKDYEIPHTHAHFEASNSVE